MANVKKPKKCALCSNVSTITCPNCNQINYCTKQCQKEHWNKHRNDCKPFTIKTNKTYGRYLIASKDIKQGELILKERPIIVGPSIASIPLCFKCYKPISPFKQPVFCPECNVAPLCTLTCKNAPGHTTLECAALKTNPFINAEKLLQHYQSVMPLRCLLLRETEPKSWYDLTSMEAHLEQRRNTPIWRNYELNVAPALKQFNVLSNEDVTDELVQKICGILDVNSFELRIPGFETNWQSGNVTEGVVRGVYAAAALMAHDCVANTHLAVDDSFVMSVHASVPIAKNTPIYFNYTNALQGTFERQQHLQQGKYFKCICRRCSDATELGTYMSSLMCVKCRTGFVRPIKVVDVNGAHAHNSQWTCSVNGCNYKCHGSLIKSTVNYAKQLIDDETDTTNLNSVESLLKTLLFTFTPAHALILDLKQRLIGLYSEELRRCDTTTKNTNRKYLARKLQLCKELIPILERVEPGISRLTGITLYEMHVPMVILANREYDNGEITADDLLKRLCQAEEALKKSISYLLYEPSASPEGRLASRALNELKLLRKNTSNVQQIVANKCKRNK